ncbi:MAG: MFS transporter [Bacteroidales bacterium]|nr:MFS transporter [Bacteroidales bacterium]
MPAEINKKGITGMLEWYRLFIGNKRLLVFGFLFSFFSSFGQTFFISIFLPFWVDSLHITKTAFGSLYAIITIFAAVLLSLTGKFIDSIPLRKYASFVFGGLIVSVIFLSLAKNILILTLGLFLVRWLGQGMMTHTASTGIAKYFDKDRGKALSFSVMGQPAGTFIFPFIVLPLISLTGWSNSLLIMAIISLMIMAPVLFALKSPGISEKDRLSKSADVERTSLFTYLKSIRFWIIALNIFTIPFICTAVFLYQYSIGEAKGWSVAWVAFSFSFFAIFSAAGLLLSGNLTDRFTGLRLFPLYLIPAILASFLIAVSNNQYVFPVFYALLGLSSGLGSTIKTATQTEIYGSGKLGQVRSYFSTILVIGTALGPPVFAFFFDRNVSFNTFMAFSGVFIIITAIASSFLWPSGSLKKLAAIPVSALGMGKKSKI